MSPQTLDCLRDLIRIVETKNIRRAAPLTIELRRKGYSTETVTEALLHWAAHRERTVTG